MQRILPIVTGLLLLGPLATNGVVAQDQRQDEGRGPRVIDVRFDGGTAVEYIEAIRRAAGEGVYGPPHAVNIIVAEHVDQVQIEPLELKRVDVQSAVSLLDSMHADLADRYVILDVKTQGQRSPGGLPIHIVRAEVEVKNPGQIFVSSRVWSVRSVLERGVEAEDLLTAIDTALDLFDSKQRVDIKFHAETALVLARGNDEQIGMIHSVIDELMDASPRDQFEDEMKALRHEAELELERRQHEFERQSMQHIDRAAMFERTQIELQQQLADREVMIRELQMTVARLQDQLDAARK